MKTKSISACAVFAAAAAVVSVLTAAGAFAADRTDLHLEDVGRIRQDNAAITASGAVDTAHARHERALRLDRESRLFLIDRSTSLGIRRHRYQQTFRGIPVFGEQVIVGEDVSGDVRVLFGRKISGLAAEVPASAPRLSAAQALAIGRSVGLGTRQGFMRSRDGRAQLTIHIDDAGRARKAYAVTYFADTLAGGSPTRPMVLVDADNGQVLTRWENLQRVTIGTGPGGNLKTGLYEYGLDYGRLDVSVSGTDCLMDNPKARTENLHHGGIPTYAAHVYPCPRNTLETVNGAYSPLNDAHYFATGVYDMYQAYAGMPPSTSKLMLAAHYATDFDDAFWDGVGFVFGDGWTRFYPLTGLDVVAHEISHGFTAQNSSLIYSGQSGAINEAFSDIAGEAAEYYLRGFNDFLVGADISKNAPAVRYMENPRLDGLSIDHVSKYVPSMDVHYASGVYNKASYLLAKKTSWNTRKVFQVFARANDLYWDPSISFNRGVCGLEQAAADFGYAVADVTAAFAAVGAACNEGRIVDTHGDDSGKLIVAYFERMATVAASHHDDFEVEIPAEYVVIGGGAEGKDSPVGNLLTASYPRADLGAWVVSTKDHLQSDPVKVRAWAIGLKIVGLTPDQVRSSLIVSMYRSAPANHPDATAQLPAGYVLAGGGFKVNWSAPGNLATRSMPVGANGWRVSSKDHLVGSPATIEAYAIGLRDSIPGVGSIVSAIGSSQSTLAAHPVASAAPAPGYATTGCGATVTWSGAGNLLWKLRPATAASGPRFCVAASKDQLASSPATITAYAIGLRAN